MFRNKFIFYGERLLAPHPTPKLEDHPLSSLHSCLFNVFAANLHYWRQSLYPRPKDVPCCGNRDPPTMVGICILVHLNKLDLWHKFYVRTVEHSQTSSVKKLN
jgi:hypothetical protein